MEELQSLDIPKYGGEGGYILIAGPCSAESEEQVIQTGRSLAESGVGIFRAGLWKPRTKPGCFEGVGSQGLPWLAKVREQTGMLIATEVATREHVQEAVGAGIDILWIGARTSANPFAVQEIADELQRLNAVNTRVLVKNPVNPDLELWIGALQRLYNAGIRRLGAVHRGFSYYGPQLYRNIPEWKIPIELRLRYPRLPIIVDPSHIGGKRELIAPLSQQALDMGFDGLIIESHCNPQEARSDASQQLTPEALGSMLQALVVRDTVCPTEDMATLRRKIDMLDDELMNVLARRLSVCREIGEYKLRNNVSAVQTGRIKEIIGARVAEGARMGIGEEFMKTLLLAIHDESVRQQLEIINKKES